MPNDPLQFAADEARRIDHEAARLSRLEGRHVDWLGLPRNVPLGDLGEANKIGVRVLDLVEDRLTEEGTEA